MVDSVRIRKDVWKLAPGDQTLEWYGRAVAEMRTRPLADPTSWRYQAAIHRYVRSLDPLSEPTDTPPTVSQQQRFWTQCQHNTWFFLPWHRMYLACFEQIVAAAVVSLGGPDTWALPYWNYSDSHADALILPPAFRIPADPSNPLWVADRNFDANAGAPVGDGAIVDLTSSLNQAQFAAQAFGGSAGFGGPDTNGFHHGHGVGRAGDLERLPHGSIHNAVGGWMSQFNTAALDPIFWLHHANIDRLWVVWRNRNTTHLDPTDNDWLDTVAFELHDAGGNEVSFKTSEVLLTTAPRLNYEYDDVSDPLGAAPPSPEAAERSDAMPRQVIPEMVGATDPIALTGEPTSTSMSIAAPAGPALEAIEAGGPPPQAFLNIENITGPSSSLNYGVYLNVPPDDDPQEHPDLFAGIVPTFGVAEASEADAEHGGSGLFFVLEVSEIIQTLEARDDWDPDDLRITFVPRTPARPEAVAEAADVSPIRVGRVSLYYA